MRKYPQAVNQHANSFMHNRRQRHHRQPHYQLRLCRVLGYLSLLPLSIGRSATGNASGSDAWKKQRRLGRCDAGDDFVASWPRLNQGGGDSWLHRTEIVGDSSCEGDHHGRKIVSRSMNAAVLKARLWSIDRGGGLCT
jgi:hypothetical protein